MRPVHRLLGSCSIALAALLSACGKSGWPEGMAQGQGRWGGSDDREEGGPAARPQNRTRINAPVTAEHLPHRKRLRGLTPAQQKKMRERQPADSRVGLF